MSGKRRDLSIPWPFAPAEVALNRDTNLLKLLSALIVALFLALPYWKGKFRAKPSRKGGSRNA